MSKPIKKFARINFSRLKFVDKSFVPELNERMKDAELLGTHNISRLLMIVSYASVVEGLLFQYAEFFCPAKFNAAKSCPKKNGYPKEFSRWTFAEFIKVSHEIGVLKYDTMKYVDILRDFRNHAHPQKKVANNVKFSEDTVIMCKMTLDVVIKDMKKFKG